jgi:hypothetical protein
VLEAAGLAREPLSRLVRDDSIIDMALVGALLVAMQANSKPVKPAMLGVIGEDHFRRRFEGIGCEMDSFQYRKLLDTDGLSTVVETAFGWCPQIDAQRRLVTGVNWSPGIINPFRQLGLENHGESLDSVLTRQRLAPCEPVIMVLHMACPRVEYTDRGKSAVVLS